MAFCRERDHAVFVADIEDVFYVQAGFTSDDSRDRDLIPAFYAYWKCFHSREGGCVRTLPLYAKPSRSQEIFTYLRKYVLTYAEGEFLEGGFWGGWKLGDGVW